MEPVSMLAGALASGTMEEVAGQVIGWARGKLKPVELRQLSVRHWGCVLFEMRSNIVQLARAVVRAEKSDRLVPRLHTIFSRALFGEIVRMTPHPILLANAVMIIDEHRMMESYVANWIAVSSQWVTVPSNSTAAQSINPHLLWLMRAGQVTDDQIRRYNQLRDIIAVEGKEAYKREWKQLSPAIIPERLPPGIDATAKERLLGSLSTDEPDEP